MMNAVRRDLPTRGDETLQVLPTQRHILDVQGARIDGKPSHPTRDRIFDLAWRHRAQAAEQQRHELPFFNAATIRGDCDGNGLSGPRPTVV